MVKKIFFDELFFIFFSHYFYDSDTKCKNVPIVIVYHNFGFQNININIVNNDSINFVSDIFEVLFFIFKIENNKKLIFQYYIE